MLEVRRTCLTRTYHDVSLYLSILPYRCALGLDPLRSGPSARKSFSCETTFSPTHSFSVINVHLQHVCRKLFGGILSCKPSNTHISTPLHLPFSRTIFVPSSVFLFNSVDASIENLAQKRFSCQLVTVKIKLADFSVT